MAVGFLEMAVSPLAGIWTRVPTTVCNTVREWGFEPVVVLELIVNTDAFVNRYLLSRRAISQHR